MSGPTSTALLLRFGLVVLFMPFSALDKVFGFEHAVAQARKGFGPRPLAIAVLLAASD